jgi:hypothetical protein
MQNMHNVKIVVDNAKQSLTISTLANKTPVSTNLKAQNDIRKHCFINYFDSVRGPGGLFGLLNFARFALIFNLRQNNMKKALLDLLAVIIIAAALTIGALAYFDVLVK